jgi:hypothetical protein
MDAVVTGVAVAALVADGLLAGLSLDKVIVQLPARRRMGVVGYAGYARSADLGNGVAFYALVGVSAAVLTVAAFGVAAGRGAPGPVTSAAPGELSWHQNAIGAATRAGVAHLVRSSILGADPAAPARFLRDHGQADEQLRASGVPWTILRPNFYMHNVTALWPPTLDGQGNYCARRPTPGSAWPTRATSRPLLPARSPRTGTPGRHTT